MDRMQRMSLISLSLVVVLAIGLSLKSFGARLRAPFHLLPKEEEQDVAAQEAQQLLRLKVTDTDKDTLSDYDEMYAYKTSPYIPDSDSDGYNDAEEVRSGNDPNCPKGNDCSIGIVGASIDTGAAVSSGPTSSGVGAVDPYSVTDPAQVRALIVATGAVSAADLEQVDDATLMQLWDQVKGQVAANGSATATTQIPAPDSVTPLRQDSAGQATKLPVNPPVAEVRKLLEQSGVSRDVLSSVDDATLMKLYEETRKEQEAGSSTSPQAKAKNP